MTKRIMPWIVAIAIAAVLAISIRLSAQEPEEPNHSHEPTFTTIDVPGAVVTTASGISPRGDIVGLYYDGNNGHGFLRRKQ
jgi:hypothetical protein